MIPSIIQPNSVTVLIGGKTLTATSTHPNYSEIRDALKAANPDAAKIAAMFDVVKAIETKTGGRVQITGNTVTYDGKPLHNTLTARMIAMLGEGFDITPLTNFLEKLMQNPSHRAVNGLYDFLAATNIPITKEGDFLAFKKVRDTYMDIHSNTMRNAPGDVLRVARNQVDEDPDRTCSHGLHVCSESYLPHFGGAPRNRVVIVQVNPADVVAVPRDYNNAKMRCSGYVVVGEVAGGKVNGTFNSAVMGASDFQPKPVVENTATLRFDSTDVIKNIGGVAVRFYLDGDDDWVAEWPHYDGETPYNTEYFYVDTLEEAIEDFKADYVSEVCDWTAEVRWLNDDGTLGSETVTIEGSSEDEPYEGDFADEVTAPGFEDADNYKVINITSGPAREALVED